MFKKRIILILFLVLIISTISIPMTFATQANDTSTNQTILGDSSVNNTQAVLLSNSSEYGSDYGNISIKSQLTGNNLTKTYGYDENYSAKLTDLNGNPIIGQHIALNLSRVSNGASKVYWQTSDTEGNIILPITLAPGYYTVNGNYAGNKVLNYTSSGCFNTIIVNYPNNNKILSLINLKPFSEVYGTSKVFVVSLTSSNGFKISGQQLNLSLSRSTGGASKVYWLTTDVNGNVELPINLGIGSYIISVNYNGNNMYSSSGASTTIQITNNTFSNNTFRVNDSFNLSLLKNRLTLNMNNWEYDSINNIYYQLGLVYCINPVCINYESLGIYVPGDYMIGTRNSNGTYTCKLNNNASVGLYNPSNAPIIFPVNTLGYAANPGPSEYNYSSDVESYINEGFIYILAGCRGRTNGPDYCGGAPWGVTDLKAAINYIKFNNDTLPGDTNRIFTYGMSGGGAQSALLGVTGDSALYNPYLTYIGAAMIDKEGEPISNSVCGSMCWCPVTSFDYADEAYEWNMGQYVNIQSRADNHWTSSLSDDLSLQFALYINKLGLKSQNGTILTLNPSSNGIYASGTYYDYLIEVIEESLNNYLNDTNFSKTPFGTVQNYINTLNSNGKWVIYNPKTNTGKITNMKSFIINCKEPIKPVGASDDLNCHNPENELFGNSNHDYLHFDSIMGQLLVNNSNKYSKYDDYNNRYWEDFSHDLKENDLLNNSLESRVNMYNPLYYLCDYYDGYGSSNVAEFWRISTGISQRSCALTVETNLALALQEYSSVKSVEFQTVWNQGHIIAERNGNPTLNFIDWVNMCLKM
ncbi:MAG: hypothetical protein K1X33_09345 [Methanobacteriaceae archaeon]|nr:hypothetical protein [Methanobacteriaceae archaeon]